MTILGRRLEIKYEAEWGAGNTYTVQYANKNKQYLYIVNGMKISSLLNQENGKIPCA